MQLMRNSMHKKPWQITEDEGACLAAASSCSPNINSTIAGDSFVAGFYPWLHLHLCLFCGLSASAGEEEQRPWHGVRDQAGDPATSARQGHNHEGSRIPPTPPLVCVQAWLSESFVAFLVLTTASCCVAVLCFQPSERKQAQGRQRWLHPAHHAKCRHCDD